MKIATKRLKLADEYPEEASKVAQRLHIKKDEIPLIRKYYISEKKDDEVSKQERTIISRISCVDKDRDGESLLPEGVKLENYRKNPIVCWGHSYREPQTIVGKNLWIKKDDKGLIAKTVFAKNEFADQVFKAYTEDLAGTGPLLKGWSVGFIPLKWEEPDTKGKEDAPKKIFTSWEMLEYSTVPIPASPDSLSLAYKKGLISERLKKDLEIEVVKDRKKTIEIIRDVNKKTIANVEDIKESSERIVQKIKDRVIEVEKDDPEIDIEEATKDIIELLVIDKESTTRGKVGGFAGKYKLKSKDGTLSVMDAVNAFAWKYGLDIDFDKEGKVVITKPETLGKYHHIPVNPGCKITATITISAAKGIKATYCGEVKKIHTYLFDVEKWTMEEAKAWVKENHKRELEEYIQKIVDSEPQYKERWNKSLSKLFDIASAESPEPLKFHYDLYEKFLECKVKEIFQNGYVIPSPLLGTYLAGFKEILGEFDLKDTRKFSWDGSEVPPDYEVIQLNSEKSDDFLISGMCFYAAEKKPLVVNFSPDYFGLTVTLTTSNENKEWNKELLDKVHSWVYENNFLKGEKFSLSGEFLHEPDDDWDNLILDGKYKDSIRKSANFLEKKGKEFTGRGLLFIGPPGTGKTKTGRVLMNELDATFIWVSSKDFRHVGPLRALALGFSLARSLAPAVLFLEDIDTWLRGEMEFVTDLIKTEMDGIKQNRGIITILTSNYPEKLPDALLDRPGRFHHIVNFELPKAKYRMEMLELWAGDIGEALLREITEKTDGFSGAHIKELVEFAKMIAEEDEIEIGKALIMSLDKLTEQRELIEEIRGNKTDVKAVWGRVKYEEGEVKIMEDREIEIKADEKQKFNCECIKCGHKMESDKHCNEIKCPECGGEMRRAERPGPGKEMSEEILWLKDIVEGNFNEIGELKKKAEQFLKAKEVDDFPEQLKGFINTVGEQYDKILAEKDEIIADLKEGRVLSRKNRKIVKDAIVALDKVLKADSAGSREDEESESGTVTEREVEIVRDGEKEFSKEDIAKVVKEVSGKQMGEILEGAFKKALDPEKIKAMVGEGIRLELDKLRGKVT